VKVEQEQWESSFNPKALLRLLSYLKPYRGLLTLALLGLILAVMGELLTPVIIQRSMDQYIIPADPSPVEAQIPLNQDERMLGLKRWSRYFMVLLFLSLGANFIQVYFSAKTGQRVMKDIRSELFAHLMRQNLKYLGDTPVGSLVSRVTSDVETVNELFTTVALALMKNLALIIGALITLFLLNVPLAWVLLATLPPLLILTLLIRSRIRRVYRDSQHQTSRINAFLSESLMGMEIIQLFGRVKSFLQGFTERNQSHYKASMREMYTFAFFRPVVNLFTSLSVGFLIYYGTGMHNRGTVSLGVLIAFLNLVDKIYEPVKDMTDKITILQSAMAGGERVFKMLDRDESMPEALDNPSMEDFSGAVEFRDVRFRYKEEWILKGMSFRIHPGETLAVVGTTGAGKTTLANLLARFWDIDEGQILLDGRDIRSIPLGQLRRHIQTVQQDVSLFSGTIRENISLGMDVPDDDIRKALRMVGAEPLMRQLPQGLDTELTQGAGNLSFGQRQLISFARIFVFNPSMIILDEATSNIDTETESWIQKGMEELLQGRTALVIAHRLSTIARADRILVLKQGVLVEEGSHKELMKKGGVYYNLYQLQYKE